VNTLNRSFNPPSHRNPVNKADPQNSAACRQKINAIHELLINAASITQNDPDRMEGALIAKIVNATVSTPLSRLARWLIPVKHELNGVISPFRGISQFSPSPQVNAWLLLFKSKPECKQEGYQVPPEINLFLAPPFIKAVHPASHVKY